MSKFSTSAGSSPQTAPTTPSSSSNNSDEFQPNDVWTTNVFSNPSGFGFGSPSAAGGAIGLETAAGNEFDMNPGLESCAMPLQDLIHESAMSNSPPSIPSNIPTAVPSAWLNRLAVYNPLQPNLNPASLATNMASLAPHGYLGNGALPSPPPSATMDTSALFMHHHRSFGSHLGSQNAIPVIAQAQGAFPPDAFTLPQQSQTQPIGVNSISNNTVSPTNGMFSTITGLTRWQLQVHDVPKKSRVETQVKLRLDLLDVSGSPASSSSDAEGGSKPVTQWSFIRVPQTASVKTRSKGVCNPDPTSVLTLHASMFCATNPTFTNTPVPCCQACRTRENKRNAKKTTTSVKHSKSTANSKNVTPAGSTNATPATSDAEMYTGSSGVHRPSYPSQSDVPKDDYDSPIDFTCHEMLDFSSGSTPLSFRIVCYCRHYKERTGFCVLLTLRDNFNRVVGEVKTPPIMIMDDHKSVQKMTPAHTADEEEADNYGFSTKRRTKRIVSKYSEGESRIKEEDADEFEEKGVGAIRTKARISRHSTVSRSGTGLSKLTTSTAAGPPIATTTNIYNGSGHAHRNSQSYTHSESPLPTTAPSSPSTGFSPPPTQSNGESGHKMDPEGPSFTTSLFSPTSTSPAMLGTVSIASMPPVHMPMSGIPSLGAPTQVPTLPVLQSNPHPHITRAIPTAGPMTGGIEVTLLGSNFSRDALANAYILFGNNAVVFGGNGGAQVYSESAIICTLPPSAVAGPVEVKLLGVPRPEPNSLILDPPAPIFTYTDEGDRDLMMQALQILGWQNSGQWQDPRSVAANILGGASTGMMGIESTNATDMSSLFGNGFQTVRHAPAQFKQQRQGKPNGPADVEDLVLKVLRSAQNPVTGTIKHISAAHPVTGQTLLHLASALGFAKLVNALIGWSADVDIADKNGFSPVHFACFYGRVECVDTLVRQGRAHLEGRDLQDRTPFDVCGTEDVKDLVLELEEEVETRRRRSTVNSEIESGGEGDDEEDEEEYEPSISEVDPMQSLSRHISRVNSVASIASSRKISRAATPFSLGDIMPPLHALPSRAPIPIHSPPSATESPVAARPGVNSWSLPPMPWPVQFPTGWQLPNVPAMPQFGRRRVHPHSGEGQRKRHDEKAQDSEKMMFMWMEYVKNMWIQQQQQGSTTQMENDPPPSYTAEPSTSVPREKMAPAPTSVGTPAMPTVLDEPPSPLSLDSPSMTTLAIPKTSSHSNLSGRTRYGHQAHRRRADVVEYVVSEEDVVPHSQQLSLSKTTPRRKTKTQDTMLIFFWIPVLLFVLAWMTYRSLGTLFHLVKPAFETSFKVAVEAKSA